MEEELSFTEKFAVIQHELKAPKDKSTYAYKYRNAEDILGKAKPLLVDQGLVITLDDEVVAVGEPCRWFIKSVATVTDGSTGSFSGTGVAEILTPAIGERSGKASMNESQATGATSSYARKYALGALFGLDDGDDADDERYRPEVMGGSKPVNPRTKPKTQPVEPVKQDDPQPIEEVLGDALGDTTITPEVLKELNFLPGAGKGNLGLPKETVKEIWDDFYHQGWSRGKFDMGSKTWSNTKIPMSAVPTIVTTFCEKAGLSEDAIKAKISQVLASVPDVDDLADYSDEPF